MRHTHTICTIDNEKKEMKINFRSLNLIRLVEYKIGKKSMEKKLMENFYIYLTLTNPQPATTPTILYYPQNGVETFSCLH